MRRIAYAIGMIALLLNGGMGVAHAEENGKKEAGAEKKVDATLKIDVPTTYIAVVDVQKVILESKASQSLREQVNKQRRKDREDLEKREDALRDEQQGLEKQRAVLSQDAYNTKVRAWEKKAATLNREVEKRRTRLEKASQRSLTEVQKNLLEIVHGISVASNITMIVSRNQLVMADKNMDITQLVLDTINKRLPKVSLKLE